MKWKTTFKKTNEPKIERLIEIESEGENVEEAVRNAELRLPERIPADTVVEDWIAVQGEVLVDEAELWENRYCENPVCRGRKYPPHNRGARVRVKKDHKGRVECNECLCR